MLGVGADAVRAAITQIGPHAPVLQAAAGIDAERGEPLGVGLGHDQRRAVAHHQHAIGECQAAGHLLCRAVGCDQGDHSGCERLAGHHVEAATVDVRVAAAVDNELVHGRRVRRRFQVAIGHQRPILLAAQKQPVARRHNQQPAVWQPVDAQRE